VIAHEVDEGLVGGEGPGTGASSCRPVTIATWHKRRPTSCPRSSSESSEPCWPHGHEKATNRPNSERLHADDKKSHFGRAARRSKRSANYFFGGGRQEQAAPEPPISSETVADEPLAGLTCVGGVRGQDYDAPLTAARSVERYLAPQATTLYADTCWGSCHRPYLWPPKPRARHA
jgi:hypothetical protein